MHGTNHVAQIFHITYDYSQQNTQTQCRDVVYKQYTQQTAYGRDCTNNILKRRRSIALYLLHFHININEMNHYVAMPVWLFPQQLIQASQDVMVVEQAGGISIVA